MSAAVEEVGKTKVKTPTRKNGMWGTLTPRKIVPVITGDYCGGASPGL